MAAQQLLACGEKTIFKLISEFVRRHLVTPVGNLLALLSKEPLLVSKALPIFRTPYYFCAYSDLSLLYEAYDFSSQSEV